MGVTILLLSGAPTVAVAFPIVILVGMASISFMTSTTAIVQVHADPRMHGRVLALQTVLLVGSTPIGGPILGAIADAWGARAPLVIGGIAALLAAAWGFWMDRRLGPGALLAAPGGFGMAGRWAPAPPDRGGGRAAADPPITTDQARTRQSVTS